MSEAVANPNIYSHRHLPARPLGLVENSEQLWGSQLRDFDGFLPAEQLVDLSGESVMSQEHWQPNYSPSSYDRNGQVQKLIDVAELLKVNGSVDLTTIDQDLHESIMRTNKTFDLYEGKEAPDFDGSFAFVVPTRIERNSAEYGDEILPYLTILRHVDNATRQRALAGTCPWVLDIYHPDDKDKQGAMLFAPVFKDLSTDVPDVAQALSTSFDIIEDTIRFANEKLGANVAGLGATLPLLTYMSDKYLGRKLDVPGVTTTTGHGGTVWLLNETIARARNKLNLVETDQVGVIGTGGIGKSTADYILSSDKYTTVNLFDINQEKLANVAVELSEKYGAKRVRTADSIRDVLKKQGVIVSAVTSPITLSQPEYDGLELSGAFILDDSQPHGVDREDVEAKGGKVGWVIGKDNTTTQSLTFLNGFNYGGWGPAKSNEVWGCQAEAGVIHLQEAYDAAITKAVTPETAHRIGDLCIASGIAAADLQSFGRYL